MHKLIVDHSRELSMSADVKIRASDEYCTVIQVHIDDQILELVVSPGYVVDPTITITLK